jgi:cytochrome c oxidase subunit 1
MATIEGASQRPTTRQWLWGWLTTVDHKRIGILYGCSAIIFFLLGGIEALLMRVQLARPDHGVISPEVFNQLFTMHGTTMIFLVVMPMSAAFFNYLIPLMIGARDVAFPRLNAFSYWTFLAGGIFLNTSWFLGGAPNAGWFGYANLTSVQFNPGVGIDFWALGLQVLGIASLAAGFNFVVTIINMRAPGMSLMRMPVFVWMTLVTSFLIILAFPVITVALIELLIDRLYGGNFFVVSAGADPLLWQHLFWIFGHPEVYILILPAMGIVSEIVPTFSRKPLFGYPFIVLSGVIIAFMGFAVWSHHMFTVGLSPIVTSIFAITTMAIAVPTGVKIFSWMGTLWGGSIRFTSPLLFALGFISMFIMGGLSGIMHSIAPHDAQQQDTYFVVAHLHYVLFGGSIFALAAGLYYWFPKMTGRMMSEKLGHLNFWTMLIGFNLTFMPMHVVGLNGMPRRVYTYQAGLGWDFWNMVITIGAFLIAISVLILLHNLFWSYRKGKSAGRDPWDGRTLEWSIPSPPFHYNFAEVPTVQGRDDYWIQKYGNLHEIPETPPEVDSGKQLAEDVERHDIHMPNPSYYPLVASVGIMLAAYGLIHHLALVAVGVVTTLLGIYGWVFEPGESTEDKS